MFANPTVGTHHRTNAAPTSTKQQATRRSTNFLSEALSATSELFEG